MPTSSSRPAPATHAAEAPRHERRAPRKQLGEFLVEKGLINRDQLRVALTEQKQKNERLGKILVRLGLVSESVLRDVLAEMLRVESIDLSKVVPDHDAVALLPEELARRLKLLPISYDPNTRVLTVAMSDTFDVVALDQVAALLGGDIEIRTLLASEAEIQGAIETIYDREFSLAAILQEIDTPDTPGRLPASVTDEVTQPLVRLVDALLADAVKRRASDIHLEPEDGFIRVRYRVDGVLQQVSTVHKKFWGAMVVRLKVMSGMDITETRAPQDGRISLNIGGRSVDFRVAAQPTIHGENIVLRILDRRSGIVPLDDLGLPDDQLTLVKMLMARPEGVILVTGPTGSGKTTTLYSILNYRNDESVNIMTLEDPVEYPFPMIRQTSLGEAVKLDFAGGIRSLMRQDPDIILVGEIRDEPTADMAFRAAMTGHQVYSTLHTNSALGAIPRLLDIGLKPGILAGNIIGIIAQRLVRRLCPSCRTPYEPSDIERRLMGLEPGTPLTLQQAQGCERCNNQGYRGRLAIMEIVRFDRDLDYALAEGKSLGELRAIALAKGFRPLADDGIRRVLTGDTSLDEIARVVDLTERAPGSFRVSAFSYRAVDPSGRIVRGELSAASEGELDGRLLQIGLQLINCRPAGHGRGRAGGTKVSRRELINFCFHLGQAHKAGLPILDALGDLRDSTENTAFRNILASLSLAVENGRGLSDSMAAFPATFDRVFVSLIRAGEQSGELSTVLEKMTATLKWQDELIAQTKKLAMYPAFVGTVVMAVVFFLMLYVVPQMSEFLKNMGQEMPLHTRALIATSEFVMAWWYVLLALPAVAFVVIRHQVAHNLRFRRAFDRLKLRVWVIGPILEKIVMSRFVTYFQIMYASGITIVDALRTSRDLAGNAIVAEALEQVSAFVEQGNSLSASIQKAGLFPPLVIRMVKMGEDIGQLEESLLNVTYFYSREVEESVDRLQGMIEPAMTVILGLILGWVMMSVLGPIYDTIGNIAI